MHSTFLRAFYILAIHLHAVYFSLFHFSLFLVYFNTLPFTTIGAEFDQENSIYLPVFKSL